eukprot:scaffold2938_cov122-Skeletonema_menzelii.AAC.2
MKRSKRRSGCWVPRGDIDMEICNVGFHTPGLCLQRPTKTLSPASPALSTDIMNLKERERKL